ncbi:AMP-binding protein [Mycobacterium xenopi]|uniref:AMP-binding protein n=1 Tax=Mycobacterium xenopi TaxID=1789 RepID=UPI001E338C65|nr:AMP-binding protein [Mycobacterium xenopi]MDA3642157.1 AMP-binding protein [Mycobacterium xenopi]MDA3660249.1 AMP-binding protein [Mycobacterium xenopi]MDA3664784.1 AMP-binding protein [Mycobacterium xenopi]
MRAAASVARSGLIPWNPFRALAIALAVRRHGRSLATLSAVGAARSPDTLAVVDDFGSITYRQLFERVCRIAGAMHYVYGVRAGSTVAVLARNHRYFAEAVLGAARAGADLLLVNAEMSAEQLTKILARHQPAMLIHDPEYCPTLAGVDCDRVLTYGDSDHVLANLAARRAPVPPPVRRLGKLILLTSGTTGLAKSAARRTRPDALVGAALSAAPLVDVRRGSVIYIAAPFFHGFGLAQLAIALLTSSTVVTRSRFDAEHMLDALRRHRVTVLAAVPTMLQRMVDRCGDSAIQLHGTRVRRIITGAAPISIQLCRRLDDLFGPVLVVGYGSTELGVVALAGPDDIAAAPGTVGRPVIGVSVRILREDRSDAASGETGTVFVAGPMKFDEYLGGSDVEVVDGHLNTGDLGHLDQAGRLYIAGREDDMIVSGGENVFATEVENVLAHHPAIADVGVIGVPDNEFGQRLRAYIQPRDDVAAPTPDEVKAFVRERLERYKTPRDVVFVNSLPRNPTGKLLRSRLHQFDETTTPSAAPPGLAAGGKPE